MEVRATITTDPTDTGQSSSRVFCETIFRQPNPGQCPGVFFGDADLLNVRYRHVTDNPTAPQETKEARHEAQTSQTESENQNVTAVPRDRGGECFGRVWHGSIARLRVYSSTGMVQAFKSPGTNDDLVGFTNDPNIIRALFLARDNGRPIWGYSDSSIEWLDY